MIAMQQLALERGDVELAGDLARFLEPTAQPDAHGDDTMLADDDASGSGSGGGGGGGGARWSSSNGANMGGATGDPDADDDEFYTQVRRSFFFVTFDVIVIFFKICFVFIGAFVGASCTFTFASPQFA